MKFDPSKSYSFSFPTNIRFGINVVNELPAYLKANKLKYPLIVTDPIIKDLDFFKRIVRLLGNEGINVTVFSEISKNANTQTTHSIAVPPHACVYTFYFFRAILSSSVASRDPQQNMT